MTRICLLAVMAMVASLLGVPSALAAPSDTVVLASGASGTPVSLEPVTRTSAGLVYRVPYDYAGVWILPSGGTASYENRLGYGTTVLGGLISAEDYSAHSITWRTIADATLHESAIPSDLQYLGRTPTGYLAQRGSGPYEMVHVGLSPASGPVLIGSTTMYPFLFAGPMGAVIGPSGGVDGGTYYPYDGSGSRALPMRAGYSSCVVTGTAVFCWDYGSPELNRTPLDGGATETADLDVAAAPVATASGIAVSVRSGTDTPPSLYTWADGAAFPVLRLNSGAQLTGTLAPTTDGSGAVLAARGGPLGQAGILSVPVTGSPTLALTAPPQPRTATQVAVAPGVVAWSDNQSLDGSVWSRDLTSGTGPLSAAPEKLVASGASGSTLSVSGDRFTYTDGASRFNGTVLKDGATTMKLNQSSMESTLSGDRLLYQSRIFTDTGVLHPWSLRDLRTGRTTDLPDALWYDLWGERLARIDADGSVWVSNLRTGAPPVKIRDESPADSLWGTVQIAGDTVVWDITIGTGAQDSYTTEIKRRNVATMAAATDLAGLTSVQELSTGYAVGDNCPANVDCRTVAVSLSTGQSTRIDTNRSPDVDGNLLAYVSSAGLPTVTELAAYTDQPRLLAVPGAPTSFAVGGTTPWSVRVVSSRVLSSCTVEIRNAANVVVRSLPCTSAHAAARVTWDGKDAAGTVVTNGSYTWRIVGATGASSLADYDGSTAALGGAVNVSGGRAAGPTVTARAPAVNGMSAAVGTNVTATFSEPVTGVSGTTFQLRNAAGTLVAAAVSYNATTRTATLNPNVDLAADIRYTATLTGGASAIRNATNVPLTSTTWSFTTGPAPTVSARTPAVNGTSVAVGANVTATFNEAVQGVGGTTFTLRAPNGASVPAAVSYNATTRVATLNPSANLTPDTRYTATLTGGPTAIRDRANNPLATTSWSFTTGPAPTVTARTPANGATGVLRGANVTATFSEPVQGVGTASVVLTNPAGARITATVTYNATTRVATLDPSAALAAGTRYTVTLTGGATQIRDRAGNPLATTRWAFTTGSR